MKIEIKDKNMNLELVGKIINAMFKKCNEDEYEAEYNSYNDIKVESKKWIGFFDGKGRIGFYNKDSSIFS